MKTVLVFDRDADWYCEKLKIACPEYVYLSESGPAFEPAMAACAHILCGIAPFITPDLVRAMPRLEWIQAMTSGIDNLVAMDALPPRVAITNARGFHGPQVAELAILLMLASARRFPSLIRNQSAAVWERWPQPLLYRKTVCIVGLGMIAEGLIERCAAFGMRITGVSDGRTKMPGCDVVYPRKDLADALAEADFVVVLVPYSKRTHHLIDSAALAAMKASAILVNVSRGGTIDEEALQYSLTSGSIAGAALDVFAVEPLPEESPFWSMPNAIVTPHIGGMSDIYHEQVLPIICENLIAYKEKGAGGLKYRVQREGEGQDAS